MSWSKKLQQLANNNADNWLTMPNGLLKMSEAYKEYFCDIQGLYKSAYHFFVIAWYETQSIKPSDTEGHFVHIWFYISQFEIILSVNVKDFYIVWKNTQTIRSFDIANA